MIFIMSSEATQQQLDAVVGKIKSFGLDVNISCGTERTVVGAIGDVSKLDQSLFKVLPGVDQFMRIVKPYKIVAREGHLESSVIDISGVLLGGKQIQVIGGPCSIETQAQMNNLPNMLCKRAADSCVAERLNHAAALIRSRVRAWKD